jgi:hypothetical protein
MNDKNLDKLTIIKNETTNTLIDRDINAKLLGEQDLNHKTQLKNLTPKNIENKSKPLINNPKLAKSDFYAQKRLTKKKDENIFEIKYFFLNFFIKYHVDNSPLQFTDFETEFEKVSTLLLFHVNPFNQIRKDWGLKALESRMNIQNNKILFKNPSIL